jgi:hypothetical protein
VRSDNSGGKWQERHEQEQQHVEPHQYGVVTGDEPEGLPMCHPEPGDHHKAQDVGQVTRPQPQQRFRQAGVARRGRDGDLKDQQGDGDGEYAVGQRQDPADTLLRRFVVLLPRRLLHPIRQLPHRIASRGPQARFVVGRLRRERLFGESIATVLLEFDADRVVAALVDVLNGPLRHAAAHCPAWAAVLWR